MLSSPLLWSLCLLGRVKWMCSVWIQLHQHWQVQLQLPGRALWAQSPVAVLGLHAYRQQRGCGAVRTCQPVFSTISEVCLEGPRAQNQGEIISWFPNAERIYGVLAQPASSSNSTRWLFQRHTLEQKPQQCKLESKWPSTHHDSISVLK